MLTKFLVNPKLLLYLQANNDERDFFFLKTSSYYLKYATSKNYPKQDETYEFEDKSIFTLTYDDVQNVIHINYESQDPLFKTS